MFDTLNSHFEGIHSLTSKAQPEETTLQAEIATSEYIKFTDSAFPIASLPSSTFKKE